MDRRTGWTAGELAKQSGVSARTIHRELMELAAPLADYELTLVKKSGIGIALTGDDDAFAAFQEGIRRADTTEYSSEERKVMIVCRLLEESEPVKLFALARAVQAAMPTVSRDLDELSPRLAQYGLQLIRRRGYGIELQGSETAKRKQIAALAEEYLEPSDLYGTGREQSDRWPFTRLLLELVGRRHYPEVERVIWELDIEWIGQLRDPAYTRLLVQLSVAVTRVKQGLRVSSQDELLAGLQDPSDVAEAERFLQAVGLDDESTEAAVLQSYLNEARSAIVGDSSWLLEQSGLELADRTLALIRAVAVKLDAPLEQDRSLLDGLLRHLGPALERLASGEYRKNPLLPQIKNDYEALFTAVKESMSDIWTDTDIPDEEIGYVSMHFGAALERWQLVPKRVRALLVCTSGIGSSKLLAVRITKEIPQIELAGHSSWYEAMRIPQDQYDFIISTVDLPIDPQRYIKLSPLLTEEETHKLRRYMLSFAEGLRQEPLPASSADSERTEEQLAWDRLKRMNQYLSRMVTVLKSFHVYPLILPTDEGAEELRAMLGGMVGRLYPQQNPRDARQVVDRLLERELQGSILLPDSDIAFFHARAAAVRMPMIGLFRFDRPLALMSGAEATRAFLMVAPVEEDGEMLEVLSEISALLLVPETIRMLSEGDESGIRAFLSTRLEAYIKIKMEWGEPT